MWPSDLSQRLIDEQPSTHPTKNYDTLQTIEAERQLTPRAVVAGLFTGTILCFTNMYFGLLTGWVTMGSIQSALIGYGLFQLPGFRRGLRFGPLENVAVQTISVATATLWSAVGMASM